MEDASHHGAAVDTIIIDSDCDDDGTVHQNRMRSNELGDSSGTSLLYLNDEILASIFLWLLGPEDVAYRHILPMCSASSTLSGMDIAGVDEGQSNNKVEVGDDDNDEAMPQGHQEEALDNHHGQHNGPVSHRATLENSSTPVGAVLTGREILRSLCNRTRNIIDSLCGVLTIRVKDLVESAVISDSPTIAPATLPNRITCQNYIFDFTGIHSTSLRGPLNTIVNFINTTTYTQGLPPSRMAAATLLTPPARVHLLNINPWMLEPSSRCIRDVFGVVRDIEENNKKSCCFPQRMMDDISYNHSMLIDSSSSSSFPSRRIEVVRMTLCGFIIHQQELPPLKITLNNLRSLSLAYCTIPLTGLHAASPDTVRQVPWLPSMPMLESLELRHMVAVDSSGMMSLGHGLPILSIGDSVGLPDALLEGILHRIPNLRDLLIDSSASIMCPDIASNAPKLEHLAISHCPRLRPSSIEKEEAYPTTQQTMKIVREYEALLGGGESGRDTRLSIVRDSINNGMVNQKRSLAPSSKATRDHEVHDSTQREGEQPANEDDEKDSDDTGSVDDYRRLSNGDDLMLDLIIELTTAVALGLLARLVAVNEIMYSNYQQHQQHARGASATHSTLETFPTPVSPPILHRPDLSGIHMDDDDDDDEVSSPLVEIPSPTPRNPPSTDRRQPFIPPPPPPLISIVPPLPAMHTIQQLLLVHRMPMSGLELDAPSGSTQWDSSYKETMAVLISAPVKMAFEVLAGDNKSMDWGREGEEVEEEGKVSGVAADDRHNKEPVMDGDDGDPMSSSLVDARHRAVYEYGKAYQSMIDKFMSMRTAQVTVMSQLPERQQQQLLWKGLLIQSTGAFSREGAYSTKILTYRKTLLK
ncbi:hypothetical protein Pmar_PMAR003020 [Perkinsus marinus ATCC 50983]|uniref:F-box domain-containing protein n=1 Tax=Perkinsus marinus (strain ATCC 50983 / TXsc) TaxID=423536 RepID=C5LR64_PERM5|nr:hypothetical protein Pmar_PMAR003020 [Perkinsus marinus ATCC 50983]EER00949.1 hypothetical protein Pmar_PMAR003020 [Perkinsus marinus ATCC 50983]|eukprot:XP_002768231.1 hypothetical protein Pmar_PMAR003020 [Perkinsus marinus ATCC 50983]